MQIYLFPVFILSILAYIEDKNKFTFILSNKIFYLFIFTLFTVFFGFRDEIGCDWYQYLENFKNISSASIEEIFIINRNIYSYNIGYIAITKLISYFFDFHGLIFLYSFLFTIPLFYFCCKFKRTYLTLLISYPYYILIIGMGPLRQSLAISFLLLSILFIYQKKYKFYLISIIFSSIFHHSAILLNLLFFIFLNLNATKKIDKIIKSFFIFLIFFLTIYNLPTILNSFYIYLAEYKDLFTRFSIGLYNGNLNAAKGVLFVWALNFIPSIIFLTNLNNFSFEKDIKKILILFSLFVIILLPVSLTFSIIGYRLLLYCFPSSILISTYLPDINLFGIKEKVAVNYIILFAILSLFIWFKFAYHSYCWLPYKNILLN